MAAVKQSLANRRAMTANGRLLRAPMDMLKLCTGAAA